MRLALATLFLLASIANAQPQAAEAAAFADAQTLIPEQARHTRYFALFAVPEAERLDTAKALAFLKNSLSRESDLVPYWTEEPKPGTPGIERLQRLRRLYLSGLIPVDLRDYGWSAAVWEKLAEADPYFHALVETDEYEELGYMVNGVWTSNGSKRKTGKKIRKSIAAPWLNPTVSTSLALLTGSNVPIYDARKFITEASQQTGRKGTGYYDWLQLGKKVDDFYKLVGADIEVAKRQKKEQGALIGRSTVAVNNRAIHAYSTVNGRLWVTDDFLANTDKKNVLRLLDGDTEPPNGDFGEYYGTLSNGMLAFFLAKNDGTRADSAPAEVASDSTSRTPARVVEIGISCIRCHTPGIQNIDDWARRNYTGYSSLGSYDYEKARRLRQLYLSDLQKTVKRDQTDYADALKIVNGLTPAANATTFGRVWSAYNDADVTLPMYALELGIPEAKLKTVLTSYAKTSRLDPLLFGLVVNGIPLRREHAEELYSVTQLILGGVK